MKKFWAQSMLLAALAAPAMAAETPPVSTAPPENVVAHVEVLQVSDATAASLRGKGIISGGYRGDRGHNLQTTDLMLITGKECLVAFGRKFPISYYDSRASQFQIQYVDTGMKVNVTVNSLGADAYRVENYNEISTTEKVRTEGTPVVAAYPQTNVFHGRADNAGVHVGDSIVLGSIEGPAAQPFLKSMAGADTPGGSTNLIMIMTLQRP